MNERRRYTLPISPNYVSHWGLWEAVREIIQNAYVTRKSQVVHSVVAEFVTKHGADAVPVSTQREIQKATDAGVKWVMVPDELKALLSRVQNIFIPSSGGPFQRLQGFANAYIDYMPKDGQDEINDIIQAMSEQRSAATAAVGKMEELAEKEPF